jgi:hypothetical protein
MCNVPAQRRPTVCPVPVSSLIFVVIVAIWAAYLMQHWARRREDAAATRSVDGFSEAMRVLEKRPSLPSADLRPPRPPSYAVKPARAARATVEVKRAVPAGTSRGHSPLVARRADDHVRSEAATASRAGQAADRHAPTWAGVPVAQRRLRAGLLVAALLWLPVSVVLTVTGVLMWISIPFAVVTVGAVLFWLRAEAQADRLRVTGAREGRAPARARRTRREDAFAPTPQAPAFSSDDTQVIRSTVSAAPVAADVVHAAAAPPAAARTAQSAVFDVQAPVPGEAAVVAAAAEPPAEGSWSPVPVPRPTYSLKAKAEPRYTDSGIPADVFDTPEFADEADELDDRALFARRAVAQ